jgi:hypothetical protein
MTSTFELVEGNIHGEYAELLVEALGAERVLSRPSTR